MLKSVLGQSFSGTHALDGGHTFDAIPLSQELLYISAMTEVMGISERSCPESPIRVGNPVKSVRLTMT